MSSIAAQLSHQHQIDLLNSVLADLTALKAEFNQLLADYNAHSHGGVTTGTGNSSAVAASTAAAVTLTTTA